VTLRARDRVQQTYSWRAVQEVAVALVDRVRA